MTTGIRLGSVVGVRIHLGWSWMGIGPLLGGTVFLSLDPGLGTIAARVSAAALGAVLVAISVLVHEAGHVAVAVRNRVVVERISVFLLGGFTEMELDSAPARVERRVALAGPAASALWAAVLGAGGAAAGGGSVLGRVLLLLTVINVAVAAFNLLPAYPLDGGRLVRSLLQERGWERDAAEHVAIRTGLVLGSITVVAALGLSVTGSVVALVAMPIGAMMVALAIASTPRGRRPERGSTTQRI